MLDRHKLVMDNTTKFLNDAHSVFSATHEVDYDQEGKTNSSSVFARLFFVSIIGFTFRYSALISHTACCVSDAPPLVVE